MGGSLLFKAEVPSSSLLGHLPKEFSLRLTWCPWLVGYYGTRGISRGARKLARTPSLSKKKKKKKDIIKYFHVHMLGRTRGEKGFELKTSYYIILIKVINF